MPPPGSRYLIRIQPPTLNQCRALLTDRPRWVENAATFIYVVSWQARMGENGMTGTTTLGTGHRPWLTILILLGLPLSPGWAAAPSTPLANGSFWSIQLENDVWGSGDDRYYTHGTEISNLSLNGTPGWLTRLGEGLPFVHLGSRSAVQYSVGQKIFTPRDTQQQSLISSDRPYAGWLYGSVSLLSNYIDEPTGRWAIFWGSTWV